MMKDFCSQVHVKLLYYEYSYNFFTSFTTSVGVNASRIRIGAPFGLGANEKFSLILIGEKQSEHS